MMNFRHSPTPYSINIGTTLSMSVAFLILTCGPLLAADNHVVYLPLIFHAEASDIQTSACLKVIEDIYEDPNWWKESIVNANSSEASFKSVIAAIQHKDRNTLLRWTDQKEASDTKHFDEQAGAFFRQFENLKAIAVPRAYEFDGFIVFFMKLQAPSRAFFAPFVFAQQEDGSFGFLPRRTNTLTYQLVQDWFDAHWSTSPAMQPMFCADDYVQKATHRIPLSSSVDGQKSNQSQLLLVGSPLDAPGQLASLSMKVKAKLEDMKRALIAGRIDEFAESMTLEGGNRLKQWFASASETERSEYKSAIIEQTPFFLFDLSSLVVVYMKSSTGNIQVMYLIPTPQKGLVWANSSHITVTDRVFKGGPLYKAASSERPFDDMSIK